MSAKPKSGRPLLDADDRKSNVVQVRFTPNDYAILSHMSSRYGLSRAALVRLFMNQIFDALDDIVQIDSTGSFAAGNVPEGEKLKQFEADMVAMAHRGINEMDSLMFGDLLQLDIADYRGGNAQ